MSTLEKLLTERKAKGMEKGKLEGQIQLFGLKPSPPELLMNKSFAVLEQQLAELKARFHRNA